MSTVVRIRNPSARSGRFFHVWRGLWSRCRHTLRCAFVCVQVWSSAVWSSREIKMVLGWLWVETILSLYSWSKKVSEPHAHVWPFAHADLTPPLWCVSQMERRCELESRREIASLRWASFVFKDFRLLLLRCFLQLLPVVFRLTGLWWRAQTTWRLSSW